MVQSPERAAPARPLQITDAAASALVAAMPGMRRLRLNRCSLLTDRAMADIAGLRQLQELRLGRLIRVTEQGVRRPYPVLLALDHTLARMHIIMRSNNPQP